MTCLHRCAKRRARLSIGLFLAALALRAGATALPVVSWSAAQIRAGAVQISTLQPAAYHRRIDAIAQVQSADDWLQLWSALAAARVRLQEAQATWQLARLQARRAQGLFAAGQDVALATVQLAESRAQQAQAQVQAARAAERMAQAAWRARVGVALATRLEHDPALRHALADGREWIAALTLPPGQSLPREPHIRLRAAAGDDLGHPVWLAASLIGAAPRAAARLQGLREFVAVPAANGLMPGLQLPARVEATRPQPGVWLPASSVVWVDGRAVCFIAVPAAQGAYRFIARDVSTVWAIDGGYVQRGWNAVQVVTRGAVLLLTPPTHPQPAAAGDDD